MSHDLDTARFARHLLLPEIGNAGQERLLGARVRVPSGADAGALEVAREYLTRAGVSMERETNRQDAESAKGRQEGVDASRAWSVDSGLPDLQASGVPLEVASEHEIEALAGRPDLVEAARALSGAIAAVECIKTVLGLGEPQSVAPAPLSSEEP